MSSKKRSDAATLVTDLVLRRWPLPGFGPDADKHTRGHVLVVGGSREVPGAVLLAGVAALRAGAGRVRIATARSAAISLATAFPESAVVGLPETRSGELARRSVDVLEGELADCEALLVGPGMMEDQAAAPIWRRAVRAKSRCSLILDAAALRLLSGRTPLRAGSMAGIVATPHAGEMAELWGCRREEVERAPLDLAREAAKTLNVCLVLKGQETFIAAPDGRVFRNVAGNLGLATAGSGDTLAGLIAGLSARGADCFQAAVWGVYLHARAGDVLRKTRGPLGYLARELSDEVPKLLGKLTPVRVASTRAAATPRSRARPRSR